MVLRKRKAADDVVDEQAQENPAKQRKLAEGRSTRPANTTSAAAIRKSNQERRNANTLSGRLAKNHQSSNDQQKRPAINNESHAGGDNGTVSKAARLSNDEPNTGRAKGQKRKQTNDAEVERYNRELAATKQCEANQARDARAAKRRKIKEDQEANERERWERERKEWEKRERERIEMESDERDTNESNTNEIQVAVGEDKDVVMSEAPGVSSDETAGVPPGAVQTARTGLPLPPELVLEVCDHLGVKAISSLARTSKRLKETIYSRFTLFKAAAKEELESERNEASNMSDTITLAAVHGHVRKRDGYHFEALKRYLHHGGPISNQGGVFG